MRAFSKNEKLLLLAPLPFLAFLLIGNGWKRESERSLPETLPLPDPVSQAFFLSDNKVLVVTKPINPSVPFTTATYELGQKTPLKTGNISRDITSHDWISQVSLDGKYWMAREYSFKTRVEQMLLVDTQTLKPVQIIKGENLIFRWSGPRELLVLDYPKSEKWSFDDNQRWARYDAGARELFPTSPDGKWQIIRVEGDPVKYRKHRENDMREDDSFTLESHYVVSTQSPSQRRKLPGDLWQALSWQKKGEELWGVGPLEGSQMARRADILRFNTITGQTSTTKLEIPDHSISYSWEVVEFKFSSDGRVLVARTPDESLYVWQAVDGKLLKTLPGIDRPWEREYGSPQFSPNGQKLLRVTKDGLEIYRVDQLLPR